MEKSVCFIGHRNAPNSEEIRRKVQKTVERMIQEEVTVFIFGSRSSFNSICHDVVTEIQKEYPDIQRVVYTCRHEYATKIENKDREERIWSELMKSPVQVRDYDSEYEYPSKYTSGKASYVERNQAMIDNSDYCVFYFDESYQPSRRKSGKLTDYQPKSGTAVAYQYAVQKKKVIINLFDSVK